MNFCHKVYIAYDDTSYSILIKSKIINVKKLKEMNKNKELKSLIVFEVLIIL